MDRRPFYIPAILVIAVLIFAGCQDDVLSPSPEVTTESEKATVQSFSANSCDVTVPADESNIQDGIDAAGTDETVCVEAGTYTETLHGFKDGLTLLGEGSDAVTIDVSGSSSKRGINVGNDLEDITLEGFTVTNSDDGDYGLKIQFVDGLLVQDVVATENGYTGVDLNKVDDATLRTVKASNNDAAGIALRDGDNLAVENAETSGNAWGGLALWAPGQEELTDVEITGSTFSDEPAGVFAQYKGSFDVSLMQNDFVDNTVGFVLDNQFGEPDASGFALNRNNIAGNADYGVMNDGVNTLDAECNFWGHATGPQHDDNPKNNPKGDAVTDDVNFIEWSVREIGNGEKPNQSCVGGKN